MFLLLQDHACPPSGKQVDKTYLLPFERCEKVLDYHALKSEWQLTDQQRGQLRLLVVLLQTLHKNQVMHKDLDLKNVMVCADGSWRLIDFGIAKGASGGSTSLTQTARPGHRVSVPMSVALAWKEGGVGDGGGGMYQPKFQDEVASLGVVLHAFLTDRKHYSIGRVHYRLLNEVPARLLLPHIPTLPHTAHDPYPNPNPNPNPN